MFIKCSVDQSLNVGDLVQYNPMQDRWQALSSSSELWGVVVSTPTADETEGSSLYLARIQFSGACLARASQDIANQGGSLGIEVGGVYIDSNSDSGIVAPNPYNQQIRVSGDLVMIHIR